MSHLKQDGVITFQLVTAVLMVSACLLLEREIKNARRSSYLPVGDSGFDGLSACLGGCRKHESDYLPVGDGGFDDLGVLIA